MGFLANSSHITPSTHRSSAMSPSRKSAAVFLCSDLASGITGEITYVDGGFNTTSLDTTEA